MIRTAGLDSGTSRRQPPVVVSEQFDERPRRGLLVHYSAAPKSVCPSNAEADRGSANIEGGANASSRIAILIVRILMP